MSKRDERSVSPSVTHAPFDVVDGPQSRALEAVSRLLRSRLTQDDVIEVLGAAFVAEAVRPHWSRPEDAAEALERLRIDDAALADAVEGLASLLLGRSEARQDRRAAIAAVEDLLRQ
ncbi:MAG: hypothetical protein R3C29_13300 [Dehalococcoidia bacterium]